MDRSRRRDGIAAILISVGMLMVAGVGVWWSSQYLEPVVSVERSVQVNSRSDLYEGQHSVYFPKVAAVQPGEPLVFLGSEEGWVQVRTPTGTIGWIQGEKALISDGRLRYHVTAQQWQVELPGASTLTLSREREGVLRLRIGGRVKPSAEERGDRLFVSLPTGVKSNTELPVHSDGVDGIRVEPGGVSILLPRMPVWQTHRATDGFSVLMQPRLEAVTAEQLPDRMLYRFTVRGSVAPRTSADGGVVTVLLPGAASGAVAVPSETHLTTGEEGVRIQILSGHPFGLRRTPEGFALHLYRPGLAGRTILIDPGHGGSDAGAWNPAFGLREKEVNLQVALQLRELLTAAGADVRLTRTGDTRAASPEAIARGPQEDLANRIRLANEQQVDLFLSIHHNAGGQTGTESFFTPSTLNGERSGYLARLIQGEVTASLGLADRGAKPELFFITRQTDVPAVLIELAFIDHPGDARLIQTAAFRDKAAAALCQAIRRYFAVPLRR